MFLSRRKFLYKVSVRKKSCLSLREKELAPRFEFVTEKEEREIRKPYLPVNMQRSTQWALKVFSAWMKACQESGMESCPVDLLERSESEELSRVWFSYLLLFLLRLELKRRRWFSPSEDPVVFTHTLHIYTVQHIK